MCFLVDMYCLSKVFGDSELDEMAIYMYTNTFVKALIILFLSAPSFFLPLIDI